MQIFLRTIQTCALIAIGIFFIRSADAAKKYDSDYEWKTIETPHFFVHYHNGLESMAREMASFGETLQAEISHYFNWTPAEKTHLILSDQQDSPNGIANVNPFNRIEIFATPPSGINSLEEFENWKELVLKHEYVHTIQIDKAKDFPLHMRKLLGRWGYLFPGQFMPSWIHEGIATYIETDKQKGIGRGQSSYFRGLMRNEFINGLKPISMINQTPIDWPNGATPYLYGVYFFNFLSKQYGDIVIQEFFDFYSSIPVPFFLNYTARRTIGFDFDTLWRQFEEYLAKDFDSEISHISANKTHGTQHSISGYYSGFSRTSEEGNVLYIENDIEQIASIKSYNPSLRTTSTLLKLNTQSISTFSSFDYHPTQGLVIPITDKSGSSRYPTDLYVFNLKAQKLKRISEDGRYIRAAWSPDGNSIAAVQVKNGQHKLVLLSNDGKEQSIIADPGYDNLIGPLDWSPAENKIVASVFRPNSGWNLEIFNLEDKEWTRLTDNHYIESDPQFNNTGKTFLYSAEYKGVYNIYEYDIASLSAKQITNSLTVAYQPVYSLDESKVYYAELGADGFNLHSTNTDNARLIYIENRNPAKRQHIIPASTDQPGVITKDYKGFNYLKPTWWFPMLITNNYETSFGVITSANDPLYWHNYNLNIDYDLKNNNPGWIFSYSFQRYYPNLTFTSVRETFYSDTDPTQHETHYIFELELPLTRNNYRLSTKGSYQYTEIKQEVKSNFGDYTNGSDTGHLVASLSLDTRTIRRRAFLPYDGMFSMLMLENENLEEEAERHSRVVFRGKYMSPLLGFNVLDAEATVVMSGSLTERLSVGGSFPEPEKLYSITRRNYNLKGYKSGSFHGSSMQRLQLNWNLFAVKPQSSLMVPPFGLSYIFVKTYALAARVGNYNDINSQTWARSIGTEIHFNGDFGYRFWPFTIITGIAKGLDDKGRLDPYLEVTLIF